MNSNENIIVKHSLKRLIPSQTLIVVTAMLPGLVSSFLAGRFLDASSLAAISCAVPLRSVVTIFFGILSLGCSILVGRSTGKGDIKQINALYTTSILVAIIAGSLLSIIFITNSSLLAQLLNINSETVPYFCLYVSGWAFTCVPTLLTGIVQNYLQIYSQQKSIYLYALFFLVINTGLGFVCLTIFDLGLFGIGISSSLTTAVMVVFLMLWLHLSCRQIKFSIKLYSFSVLLKIFKFGSPNAIFSICRTITSIIRNMILQELGGVAALAAFNLAGIVISIIDSISLGVVGSILILANIYIGSKNSEKLYNLMRYFIRTAFKIMFVCFIIWLASCTFILRALTDDSQVVDLAIRLAFIYSPCMLVFVYTKTFISVYQSLNRFVLVYILYLLESLFMPVAAMLLLKGIIFLDAVWISYILTDLVLMLVIVVVSAIKSGRFPRCVEDLLWLDKDFYPDHIISHFALTLDEAVDYSKMIFSQLIELGIDYRRAYLCSLTCEEIGVDVFKEYIPKSKKEKIMVEYNIVVDNSEVELQVVDNAKKFKPKIYETIMASDDLSYHFGIRTAVKMSPKILYQNAAALNTFTIVYPATNKN